MLIFGNPTFRWNVALTPPKAMPFSYAAAVDLHYTKHKSYWPVGGPSEIPFHMVPVIEKSGNLFNHVMRFQMYYSSKEFEV